MTTDQNAEARLREREVTRTQLTSDTWRRRVSWGAILAGVVVALLAQLVFDMLGATLGVAALGEPEDLFGPEFTSAVVVWLAATALLSYFAAGWVTGRLAGTDDYLGAMLQATVAMGIATFISLFLLISTIGATFRGVTTVVAEGLSLVGTSVEEVSDSVASAVVLQDETLDTIRTEAEELLADDASLTSLRIALDDYLLDDEPGDDLRQAAIDALAAQTELTEAEAAAQIDEWEQEFQQTVNQLETEVDAVTEDIADALAATTGVIFMILVVNIFAAAAGGFVGAASRDIDVVQRRVVRDRVAEVSS
ncbi:MAG: hypothetical protein ACOCX5_01260 [Chloroflexota bacterium]